MKKLLAAMAVAGLVITLLPSVSLAAPPANDDLDRATVISSLPFRQRVDISTATVTAEDPDCSGKGGSLWFRFTPSDDMQVVALARRPHFRPFISIWEATEGGLAEVFCDNRNLPIFDATAGTTYFIRFAANRVRDGRAALAVNEVPPPVDVQIDVDPEGVIDSTTEEVTITGTVTCSAEQEIYYYGAIRQPGPDRRFIQGYFEGEADCSPTPTEFTETFFGDGIFADGSASVETASVLCNRYNCTESREVVFIQLHRT
jgi:hypothetical protein